MKKLLFILLMAVSATAFSQEYFYRINSLVMHDIEGKEITSEVVIDTKPLITVSIPLGTVYIKFYEENLSDMKFVILDELVSERERKLDDDGDAYNITRFSAIDNNGSRCRLSMYVYEEFSNVRVYVIYSDTMFIFYGHYLMSTIE